MTVFDPNTLLDLVDDENPQPFVFDLARTYQRLLGQRVSRVVAAVGAAPHVDVVDSLDAVLSLKVSSAMTGVEDLAAMAGSIEKSIRSGDLARAREEAARLPRAAASADQALTEYLATV
jgi:hypothetical protein